MTTGEQTSRGGAKALGEGTRGQGKRQDRGYSLRYSSHAFLLHMAAQSSQGDSGKPCLALQDALQQLPPEIHHKMLSDSAMVLQGPAGCVEFCFFKVS